MSDQRYVTGDIFEFALPDASAGGERRTGVELAGEQSSLLVVPLRDHYCPLCPDLVGRLADGYGRLAG